MPRLRLQLRLRMRLASSLAKQGRTCAELGTWAFSGLRLMPLAAATAARPLQLNTNESLGLIL